MNLSLRGSKSLKPEQIKFVEKYLLKGKSLEEYLDGKTKLSKDDKKAYKAYEDYQKLKEKYADYMDGVIQTDPGREEVLKGLDDAILQAKSGDFEAALKTLKDTEGAAKKLHKYVVEREKAKSDLEKRQEKARKEKRKKEEKAFKERRKQATSDHKDAMAEHNEILQEYQGKESSTAVLKMIGDMSEVRFGIVGGFEAITEEALHAFVETPKDAIRVPEQSEFETAYSAQIQLVLDLLKRAEVADGLDKDDPSSQQEVKEINETLQTIDQKAKEIAKKAEDYIKSNPAGTSKVTEDIRQALIEQRNDTVNKFVDEEAAAAEELIQSLIAWGSQDASQMQGKFDEASKITDTQERYRALKDLTAELRKVSADQYGDYKEQYKEVAKRFERTKATFLQISMEVMLVGSQAKIAEPAADQLQLVSNVLQSRQPNEKNIEMAKKLLDDADRMLTELKKFEEFEQKIYDLRGQVKSALGVKAHRKACPGMHAELKAKFEEVDKDWPSKGLSKAQEFFEALLVLVKTDENSFAKKAQALIDWRKDKAKQVKDVDKLVKKLDKKVEELTDKKSKSYQGDALNEFEAIKKEIDDENAVRGDVDLRMSALISKLTSWTNVDSKTGLIFNEKGVMTAQRPVEGRTIKLADHLGAQEFMADQKAGVAKLDAKEKLKEDVAKAISKCKEARKEAGKVVKSKKGKSDLKDVDKQIKQAEKLLKSEAFEDALAMIEICKTDLQRASQGIDLSKFKGIPDAWAKQATQLNNAANTLKGKVQDAADANADDEVKLAGKMETAVDTAMQRLDPKAFDEALKTFDNGDHLRAREQVLRQVRYLRELLDRDPRLAKIDGGTSFGPGISIAAAKSMLSDIERSAIVQN
ncbi:MAG: hypothetical protein AAGB05_05640 [Pseudomonadota bacterium]